MNSRLLGVDVSRQWEEFDGDLILVDGVDNVRQAIYNKLSCALDDMGYIYAGYGSRIKEYCCKVNDGNTLDAIAKEVRRTISTEPRVSKCEVQVVKASANEVIINLSCSITDYGIFSGNFILNSATNSLSMSEGETTYMKLGLGTYKCPYKTHNTYHIRPEDPLKIFCRVKNPLNDGIPIGEVEFYLEKKKFKTVKVEKGYADFTYTFPTGTPIGTYTILAHYRGLGRYASCYNTIPIKIVDKYPTVTQFKYKNLYAYPGQRTTFPVTVEDINGGKVSGGEVVYGLQLGHGYKLATLLTINNMYKYFKSTKAVFETATVVDAFGSPAKCGKVNLYIANGEGFLRATQTILHNGYSEKGTRHAFLAGEVKNPDNSKDIIDMGKLEFGYRKDYPLDTTTVLPDSQEAWHGLENSLTGDVIDEDGLGVTEGEMDYYTRCIRKCKPLDSKITLVDAHRDMTANERILFDSITTDEDDLPLDEGKVGYHYSNMALDVSDLPVSFEASEDIDTNTPVLAARIVDTDGIIVDSGRIVQHNTSEGIVSTYVSDTSPTTDTDLTLKMKEKH